MYVVGNQADAHRPKCPVERYAAGGLWASADRQTIWTFSTRSEQFVRLVVVIFIDRIYSQVLFIKFLKQSFVSKKLKMVGNIFYIDVKSIEDVN